MEEKDKRIRIWLAAERPSLAERMGESLRMLEYLDNTPGPSPMTVLSTCYKQLGLIVLNQKYEVCKFTFHINFNLNIYF